MGYDALFIVVNDNPAFDLAPFTICSTVESPTADAIYPEKNPAFHERDRLRAEFDNPDINVYRIEPEFVDGSRGDT